jgi:hypothetical protein
LGTLIPLLERLAIISPNEAFLPPAVSISSIVSAEKSLIMGVLFYGDYFDIKVIVATACKK